MTNNMQVWNALKHPPKTALKEIKAGRLKGMNDINPQWRIQAMTEQFGICGIGWKYTIDRQWLEPAANNEVLAFVNVSVFIRDGERWSDAIPGNGGSKLTAKESSGLYNSDEAFKMAFTDALGVAMKMLGMAADVYLGVFDGKNQPVQNVTNSTAAPKQPAEMTLDRAKVTRDSKGGLYCEKTADELQHVIDTPAAPEDKKAAAKLLLAAGLYVEKKEGK